MWQGNRSIKKEYVTKAELRRYRKKGEAGVTRKVKLGRSPEASGRVAFWRLVPWERKEF